MTTINKEFALVGDKIGEITIRYNKDKYWLEHKIIAHRGLFGDSPVIVRRYFHRDQVVIDFIGGAVVRYSYSGKWIAG